MKSSETVGIYLVMGVSGCGKSTIGSLLADRLGAVFLDGDDFHPPANVSKMASGTPLNDEDRIPWLQEIRASMDAQLAGKQSAVYACSALKQMYRDILAGPEDDVTFIYLKGSAKEIQQRLQARSGHFMPATLLQSQFDALEEPTDAISVSINGTPEEIVESIQQQIS